MRVPIYVTLPLIALSMGVIWWLGTKEKKFNDPPPASELTAVREKTLQELKAAASIAPEEPRAAIKVRPALQKLDASGPKASSLEPKDFGELTVSPALDCYLPIAGRGADVMIDLATQLELKGQTQRALLAWERVLDSTPASPEQQDTARKAIARYRSQLPPWNVDPLTTQRVVLHARCDRDRAKLVEPMLKEIIGLLNEASSGVVECVLELQIGAKASAGKPQQPLALWFQGTSADSPTSKILTIPSLPASAAEQKQFLVLQSYKLIRDGLSSQSNLRPPAESSSGDEAAQMLSSAITRYSWGLWSQILSAKKAP